ncbi:hypothetical protein GCM10023185_10970 [Hymenobacter saemangeumensis]|uniref:Right-handed parallel beta-helix repeat-containing protein n=1 Tax=Hymenobacter saemangeumensis TaxID=1084522 RepID=A0ABP8I5K8_9BACT
MRYLLPLLFLLSSLVVFLPGCEPKEDLLQTSGSLELKADTVLFDTVFTTVRTVTKRLWVYNRNSGAVKTDVSLSGAAGNTYTLLINGDLGPAVSGLTIRGKDSLLVLVRALVGDNGSSANPKDFLVEDQLHFRTNGNDQVVRLIAYGQNAYFHRGDIITSNTTWATDKPHVIINRNVTLGANRFNIGVAVAQNTTLNIPKGARIYCHAGATLQVDGTLKVNDTFSPSGVVPDSSRDIVRFQGDRREAFYNDVPGQWGGIIFTSGSHNNDIRYTEIKNATFGLLLYNPDARGQAPDLLLKNSTIRNISGSNISFANATATAGGGIISYSGTVRATNCLFTNCGEYAVLGAGGGVFNFNYCTFANYTPAFQRKTASLTFLKQQLSDPGILHPIRVTINNSIVWGSIKDELFVEGGLSPASGNSVSITNSLLRTDEYQAAPEIRATTPTDLRNLVNADPRFKRTPLNAPNRYDYSLDAGSPALNRPPVTAAFGERIDLRNQPRPGPTNAAPDLGAYERQEP